MRLGTRQEVFTASMAELIQFVNSVPGYTCRLKPVFCPDLNPVIKILDAFDYTGQWSEIIKTLKDAKHKVGSEHETSTAGDLAIFLNGEYLTKTEDYKFAGNYWESLNPLCRWGGRYEDGNHFECLEWR